jgi:hypothetical protein
MTVAGDSPNVFRQQHALNWGWPQEGKRFLAPERGAASRPGNFYFGHLLYGADTAYPTKI